ncbi:MAG: prenyltransferase/squalene oxidase repeat-containing protein [Pirellulales bacterium]
MSTKSGTTDTAQRRRQEWMGLRLATFLSIVFHLFLAAGLTRTGLGILSLPTDNTPLTNKNIFKPKQARDYPLEVSRSHTETSAHKQPLNLPLTKDREQRDKTSDPSRTVSRHQPTNVEKEKVAPQAKLPQRTRQVPHNLSQSTSVSRQPQPKPPSANLVSSIPSLKMTIEQLEPSAIQAPQQQDARLSRNSRDTAIRPRLPREVAVFSKSSALPQPRASDVSSEAMSIPKPKALAFHKPTIDPRRASDTYAMTDAIQPSQQLLTPTQQPQAKPQETIENRNSVESVTSRSLSKADTSNQERDQTREFSLTVSPMTSRRQPVTDQRGNAQSTPSSRVKSLPRSGMIAASRAATESNASPIAGSGATNAAVGTAETSASLQPATQGRAANGPRTGGIGATFGQPHPDNDGLGPSLAAAGSGAAMITDSVNGGSQRGTGTLSISHPNESLANSPARASFGRGNLGDSQNIQDIPLAVEAKSDGGQDTVGELGATMASVPTVTAPSFARTAGTQGLQSSTSRPREQLVDGSDAENAFGSIEHFDEGLSTDGMALADASLLAREPGRRFESLSNPGTPQTTTLIRKNAIALPTEGRVRAISIPFQKRMKRKPLPHNADAMVDRGLDFLKRSQLADGRWQLGSYPGRNDEETPRLASDTAATGLALLSFLGAGHDHFDGPYADTIRRGLEFLISIQKPNGDLYIPSDPLSNSCAWMYSHGIATTALCEAVGMTGDAHIQPAATKAIAFITATQHPTRKGWRYTPRSDTDLSVSGWMVIALRSGKLAGVYVNKQTLDGVRELLDYATIPPSENMPSYARFHYNKDKPEQRPSPISMACMNALGTLMRLHTGWMPDNKEIVNNSDSLASIIPAYVTAGRTTRDCYLWYYASQVLVHTGGTSWETWYKALVDMLQQHQELSGPLAGSWAPRGPIPDRWGRYGGRIYVTTLQLLTLEVPYRHLPTYSFDSDQP